MLATNAASRACGKQEIQNLSGESRLMLGIDLLWRHRMMSNKISYRCSLSVPKL